MVKLEIYRFSILNKAKEQQVLSFYNEEEDLLETLNDFCSYIHRNIRDYTDNQGKYRTFTLDRIQKKDQEKRTITGYFESSYTGEEGKLRNRETNEKIIDIKTDDLVSKSFFYLIYVPKNLKYGYLIVERKENHGVKTIFENAFNNFMRAKGVSNYYLELRQAPPRYFIKNHLENGTLKEIRLFNNDSSELSNTFGREERIFKISNSSDSHEMKRILIELFNQDETNEFTKIPFLNKGEFDEIAFVLGYNKSCKTFYIKNKEKIRSNVDVSNLVDYENNLPTLKSMIKISLELIKSAA
ncbi:hypothetical protein NAT51_05045 [Flavobacterium amniphilum]|uniref:hypothetical protein n=1 Tax=Flavobacterium amniphilum TaxID=1834035 RepID=UPI002029ECA0|nr:hypothetical protein [Flavobacterium amniphilum]MCL9804874.1 hypothetical protein [Flavobacterium amniphilum]